LQEWWIFSWRSSLEVCVNRSVPLSRISESARALGDLRSTNMVALGALTSLAGFCSQDSLLAAVVRVAPAKLHDAATRAILKGYAITESKS